MAPEVCDTTLRPATVCRQLLAALGASDGRRRRRKRTTTPDAIGMAIKHELLAGAVEDDPAPEEFEGWLLARCLDAGEATGPWRAMAREVHDEWLVACQSPDFRQWLAEGAPSDDALPG